MSKIKQIKIPLKLVKTIRITKLSDDKFEGNHPRNINEGYSREGTIEKEPKVGEEFYVFRLSGYFKTSTVTEIIDVNTFKTVNSTYEWIITDESLEVSN